MNTAQPIEMKPIATFCSVFVYKNGAPRQGNVCEQSRGIIQLIPENCFGENCTHHSLDTLDQFSHVWIIYHFHDNKYGHNQSKDNIRPKIAPPRLDGTRVGLFSTRSPHRPNPIGLTLAKIDRIDMKKATIFCSQVDLIHGTPILDIKPYIPYYDAPKGEVSIASWLEEKKKNNSIAQVSFSNEAETQLDEIINAGKCKLFQKGETKQMRELIEQVLNEDPRSLHRKTKCKQETYWFHLDELNISVQFEDVTVEEDKTITNALVFKVEYWPFYETSQDTIQSNSSSLPQQQDTTQQQQQQ